jgi:hypothetical protein
METCIALFKKMTSGKIFSLGLMVLLVFPLLSACSDNNNNGNNSPPPLVEPEPEPIAFQELYDQGIIRYLGEYTPMMSEVAGDQVNHTFGAGDGPLCIDGSEYAMSTRDAGSEDLMIFLEGGGACWSEFASCTQSANPTMSNAGIMDRQRANNPVKDWNVVYLPYCDGGLHASDKDTDTNDDGVVNWTQRGLHNLSASLDVATATFPSPRRILLTGNSGGGFGSIYALALVRYAYPDVEIEIVNDSGVGVGRPGQPEYLQLLSDDWNLGAFCPESLDNCFSEDGHFTEYQIWQMDQDPNFRRGMMSYNRDTVIADFFLAIGKDAFEAALYEEMQQLEDAYPDRQRSWIPVGSGHTFLQAAPDVTAGGVSALDWVTLMLDGSDDWVSVQD